MTTETGFNPDLINHLYPVVGVEVYEKCLVVKRANLDQRQLQSSGKRGEIFKLTKKSMSRFLFTIAHNGVTWRSMLTLTYGQNFPVSGKGVKRDIKTFKKRFFRRYGKQAFAWFLEFQERGAPHLHVVLSMEVCDQEQREEVARMWSEIVEPQDFWYTAIKPPYDRILARQDCYTRQAVFAQHKRRKTWERIKKIDGAIRYVASYLTKPHQKRVPVWFRDVGRFWSCVPGLSVGCSTEFVATEAQVRELAGILGRDVAGMPVLPKYLFHSGDLRRE